MWEHWVPGAVDAVCPHSNAGSELGKWEEPKGSSGGQSYTPPTHPSTLHEQWAGPTLTHDAVPVSLATCTGFVFCSWGQLAQPSLHQHSKVTKERDCIQSTPGKVFLVQAHTCPHNLVLQSAQPKVLSDLTAEIWASWSVSDLGPCLLTVSVCRHLAAELVVPWACAQKGCTVSDGWISSLEKVQLIA